MRRIVARAFTIIGALILRGIMLALGLGVIVWLTSAGVPAKTLLEVDFERALAEYVPDGPLARVLLTPV